MTIALAVFDVDHTLVRGSSGGALISYLWRKNVFARDHKRAVLSGMLRHRLRRQSGRHLVELGARIFAGLPEEELRGHANRCVDEVVRKLVYREALDEIAHCRLHGLTVVLASGSSELVIEPLARLVGADLAIGSRTVVRDGKFTGEVVQPIPYRQGKLDLVERAFISRNVDWSASRGYSDRAIDVPLLERVGLAVAVNPRGSLRQTALDRGWRVDRWRRLVGEGSLGSGLRA